MGKVNFSTDQVGFISSGNIDINKDGKAETFAFVLNLGSLIVQGDERIEMYTSNTNLGLQNTFSQLTAEQKKKISKAEWTLVRSDHAPKGVMRSKDNPDKYMLGTLFQGTGYDTKFDQTAKFDGKPDDFQIKFVFNRDKAPISHNVEYFCMTIKKKK